MQHFPGSVKSLTSRSATKERYLDRPTTFAVPFRNRPIVSLTALVLRPPTTQDQFVEVSRKRPRLSSRPDPRAGLERALVNMTRTDEAFHAIPTAYFGSHRAPNTTQASEVRPAPTPTQDEIMDESSTSKTTGTSNATTPNMTYDIKGCVLQHSEERSNTGTGCERPMTVGCDCPSGSSMEPTDECL
ncbi:hypothetical protein K470DRAFT_71683 [Piedraia hortae CBS 480.64]|uniref:Uncharacterized protein n=1 Tax=Piedraia hortae CBS 480.64 TaxID=1314780 RepID=A0A6A7BYC9_9PEZI|nr:hypothetical protein K470DRAFT_71683 [Piedraia hortae CBS 480.64]